MVLYEAYLHDCLTISCEICVAFVGVCAQCNGKSEIFKRYFLMIQSLINYKEGIVRFHWYTCTELQ